MTPREHAKKMRIRRNHPDHPFAPKKLGAKTTKPVIHKTEQVETVVDLQTEEPVVQGTVKTAKRTAKKATVENVGVAND